jgi:hypothetical protein
VSSLGLHSVSVIDYIQEGQFESFGELVDNKISVNLIHKNKKYTYLVDINKRTTEITSPVASLNSIRHYKITRNVKENYSVIRWSDNGGHEPYEIRIKNEQLYSLYFPPKGDLIFIGTRQSRAEGNGSLYCYKQGKLHFKYKPSESQCHPLLYDGVIKEIQAYPYRIVGNSDGSRICFTFLNHIYFMDSNGELLAKYDTESLIKAEPRKDHEHNITLSSGQESHQWQEDNFLIKCTLDYGPQPTVPYIEHVQYSSGGKYYLVSIRNQLYWLTPEGRLAHSKVLDIGYSDGSGSAGAIISFHISDDGKVVVAEVTCEGIVIMENGIIISSLARDHRSCPIVINNKFRLIVMGEGKHLNIYSLGLTMLLRTELNTVIDRLNYDETGRVLFVSGIPNVILLFNYNENSGDEVCLEDNAIDKYPHIVSRSMIHLKPFWEISISKNYACVERYGMYPDGNTICILVNDIDSCSLDIYRKGMIQKKISKKSYIKQHWQEFTSITENDDLSRKNRICHRDRYIYFYHGKEKKPVWTFQAGAKIVHSSISASGNNIVVVAGVYVYSINQKGEMTGCFKMDAIYAFTNDSGDILVLTRAQEIIICSSDGMIKQKKLLPERFERYHSVYGNEYVAFTTANRGCNTVWVADYDCNLIHCEMPNKWMCHTILEWAKQKPVLLVYVIVKTLSDTN